MGEYDAFVSSDVTELKEGEELEINIRSLEPGRYKYEAKIVKAIVSSDEGKYPDRLWLRYPKGQVHPHPWSIKIIEEVNVIPEEFR